MPLIKKPMRYAHPEGHTDVCYFTGEKGGLVTCGSDGDVRSWLNLMDDDPSACCVSEQAISVVSKNGKIFVGNDNNTIQVLSYPDLEKEGIVTRFSAPVSALATTKNSNIIVSGGCDMRIQVTDINTSDNIELIGHEAPILGLSLDPKEEFVASSSADGTIRVWNIKEKRVANIWANAVPKCNSFFTAKMYNVPSFHPKDGSYLAYPSAKDVVIVERSSWKELFRLKCINMKTEINICKFSECGTLLAASSVQGEIVVWDVKSKELIGYIEHQQNAKITALSWNIDKSDEIAFCDSLGQLGCIDVIISNKTTSNELPLETNGDVEDSNVDIPEDDDDDDGGNVISLNKIKASIEFEDDQKSHSDIVSEKSQRDANVFIPEIHLQPPFQPGSSPVHLLSRFMVWNDTGMVRCFTSEDGDESSIEVEFHDAAVHRSMHINNYLRHTIAALSPEAFALNCPSSSDTRSKLVVIALQGWGSGNKEWSLDLPEDEEGHCVAAGDNFVALATSRRHLRIFTVGGTQREIVALPGSVVAMNGLKNNLVLAYHTGTGASGDQCMNLLSIQIRGVNLISRTLCLPLSPSSELMWLGITDFGSPITMDADDVIRVYNKKSSLWKVASDMSEQSKGKADHYFLIGINEQQSIARCILCKGSHYPPTTPRPVITEVSLRLPLCEPETEKTEKELKLWKLGTSPPKENEAVLSLIALACRSNLEYRAVELCEQIASEKVIELAIKYARRINRIALSNKLESIADIKVEEKKEDIENNDNNDEHINKSDDEELNNDIEEPTPSLTITKKPDIEIKPLSMTESLSIRRSNPFLKSGNSPATKGLAGLEIAPEKPQKLTTLTPIPLKSKTKEAKDGPKKETFVSWYARNKKSLQEEFPELSAADLTKTALARYKEESTVSQNNTQETSESKKRKLSLENEQNNEPKRSSSKMLSSFAFDK
ncbi:WD repeat and HMG-box DNA-binding protein 1 [Bombus pascuorum]|uniref:WD repeat and HMG-box DNA-binding protein 1 n=1 Tax=Bombus pascuorum TaxID=65598 RepID=UPI002131AA8B|nr:WD repeat and HMG-box DNA-binding protein 1 [Bombus pascuorum]XP_060817523.1 WD repeat and HMG-box DNA-binding protein 1 [Bombus pascuorum]